MNLNKIFLMLPKYNIHEAECRYASNTSLSLEVFRGEISNFTTNTTSHLNLDAVINNKLIMANTENLTNKGIEELIKTMIETAPFVEKAEGEIYKGADKYKKYNFFDKDLLNISINEKKKLILEIEKRIKAYDSRFIEVQVSYEETLQLSEYQNSNGAKYKSKNNGFTIGAYVIAKDGDNTKSYYLPYINNKYSEFNIDEFVKEVSEGTLKKLGTQPITTGKYNVVFDPEVTQTLLRFYVSQLNAEQILKNSSWFKDKLNTLVANKRVTILETPLKRNFDFEGIDDQGVPCVNRPLIKKGMLLTYLHNLETARKFKVEPTGHGSIDGVKVGIKSHAALHLKPGRLTKEELLNKVNNGIYITELEGLHAGMNAQSGDFSLKAEGFLIKDGKLSTPVDMITVTSNLFDIFKNVKNISKNIEYIKKGIEAPCMYLNKISISC